MKALIRKDFYVLWKQMRIFILLVLVFFFFQGSFGSVFIVIWCAMLPYTALAYDERCKWDQLAAMMPYSVRDMVLSKYVLGWLCAGAASVLSLAAQAVLKNGDFRVILLSFCASVCVLAITLPLMLRFGVERGRMGMFLMIFLVCGGAGILAEAVAPDSAAALRLLPAAAVLGPAAAAVLTAVSIPVSLRLYAARR